MCFFIADSAIGMIGVCLNYSTGLNYMKFLGSSASIDPGIDKLTINSFLIFSKYFDYVVRRGLNYKEDGSILVSGVVEP